MIATPEEYNYHSRMPESGLVRIGIEPFQPELLFWDLAGILLDRVSVPMVCGNKGKLLPLWMLSHLVVGG